MYGLGLLQGLGLLIVRLASLARSFSRCWPLRWLRLADRPASITEMAWVASNTFFISYSKVRLVWRDYGVRWSDFRVRMGCEEYGVRWSDDGVGLGLEEVLREA